MKQSQLLWDSVAAAITTKTTINMLQGCKVWALLLMPLGGGGVVVVEEEEDCTTLIVCSPRTCLLGRCTGTDAFFLLLPLWDHG
jgi:hypothetical protein